MKLLAIPVCAILACLCCMIVPANAELRAQSVEIYPSGAKFVFAIEPGTFNEELPGAFQYARPLNPYAVGDYKAFVEAREDWVPPALAGLKAQIDEQNRTIAGLNARKASLEHSRELLNSLRPKEDNAKDLLEYIEKSREIRLEVERELSDLNPKITEEKAKLKRLQDEFVSRKPDASGKLLRISGTATEKLLIEAFTPEANWYPRYTMNLNSSTGAIETRMSAHAFQKTGLDYSGDIVFHTKFPSEKVGTPVVNPLRVGLKPKETETRRSASYMMDEDAAMPEMMMERAAGASANAAKRPEPVMETTLADLSVKGQGALSGDGREAEFKLGELELKGKTTLVLIPDQRSDAWIVVEMEDVKTPLIPGDAELRIDGQPAGSTKLPEYGLGQKRIPFGYAPQITVKKEPIVEKKGSGWFSGEFTSGYELEVTNGTDKERTVTVRDRLPISTDDKVKVEVKRMEPKPKEQDKENRLTWDMTLKPHETAKIVVDFTLSYPSGEELQYRR